MNVLSRVPRRARSIVVPLALLVAVALGTGQGLALGPACGPNCIDGPTLSVSSAGGTVPG